MFSIDPTNLIPQSLFTKAIDATVDVVVEVGRGVLDEQRLRQVRLLRSDGAFRVAFEDGLRRASERFAAEYVEQDEDLVAAIAGDEGFFENAEVQAALLTILQNPGVYLAEEREVVAVSFDSVLPRRRNRGRVRKAVNVFLLCLAKEVWALPALRPTYAAHFEHLTANGIQQLVSIQKAQLEANREALALNHDIRAALFALNEGLAQKKLLADESATRLLPESEQKRLRHNLPRPDYEHFVGRKKELAQVRRLLLPTTRHFVVTIDGVGGVGKSALALEVATGYLRHAQQLPEEERFEAIVWATAKRSVLTGEGISRRRQALRTLDDIYSTIAITLEREEIIRTRSEEQDELVRRVLTKQRVLLIIDNLETVDDERVMNFIREVPAPSKAIVTTRHRVDVAYPIRLEGMSQSEAFELIRHEVIAKGVQLSKAEAIRLHKRTGGVPLALVWSIAQMGFGYGVSSVLTRLGQPNNDIAKFCFEGAVEGIRNTPAHKLLMALSLFTPDGSRDALGYVANLPELDRDDGLVALEKLSLVNRKEGRFAYLPLTKSFASAERQRDETIDKEMGRRWVDYLREISKLANSEYYWRYRDFKFYIDGPNILEALQWAYINGTSEDVFELTLAAKTYLDFKGDWNTLLSLIKQALELARSIQKPLVIARFANLQAWFLQQRGEYEAAKILSLEALSQYRQLSNDEGEVITLHQITTVYRKMKEFDKAKDLCNKTWPIAENLAEGDLNALVNIEYGKLARDMQNWSLAWEHFSKVTSWFEKLAEETPSDQELARSAWGHLAIVAYHLGDPQEAKRLCLKSLEFFESFGTKAFLATLNYRLALAEGALGEHEAALEHAKHALEWFERLGMRPDYVEAKRLVEELTVKVG